MRKHSIQSGCFGQGIKTKGHSQDLNVTNGLTNTTHNKIEYNTHNQFFSLYNILILFLEHNKDYVDVRN